MMKNQEGLWLLSCAWIQFKHQWEEIVNSQIIQTHCCSLHKWKLVDHKDKVLEDGDKLKLVDHKGEENQGVELQ